VYEYCCAGAKPAEVDTDLVSDADAAFAVTGATAVAGVKNVDPAAKTELENVPAGLPDGTRTWNASVAEAPAAILTPDPLPNAQYKVPVELAEGLPDGVSVPPEALATY